MNVILLKEVENLGQANEVVTVKGGYGRNYLIPQKLAVVANQKNIDKLEQRLRKQQEAAERLVGHYKAIEEKLNGVVLQIGAKAGTSGKIFGSVSNVQIAEKIQEITGEEVDRRKIELVEEVKTIGVYTAKVALHEKVEFNVTFEVVAE